MKKTPRGLLKTLATRSVIAAIPVAMVSAYATNVVAPMPPRIAAYEYQQVAEITVSPNTVGVAASPLYGQTKAQIDQQLNEMQALGVQNIRVFVPWGLVDYFGPSAPGSLSWATLDLVMQSAKEHDMGVLAEVDSTPPYAVTAGIPGSGTPDPAAFAAFMTKFATKYGSTVSAYEIWNEPNAVLSSNPINPAAYAALVKAAYQAIKPIDPTATIVAGAVGHVVTVGNLTMDPVDFVKAMIAADPTIGQYFDALSYHPYDESLPFSQGNVNPNSGIFASDTAYNQLKDLIALFPTKKVWLSEFGVPTYSYTDANGVVHTVTQDQQEKLIADLVNSWGAAFGQNAGPIFLYTGRDTLTGSSNPEDNYGLWDMLGQPKEVITQFLAQWYKDHPQNTTVPTTPGNPGTPTDPAAALAKAFQALAQQIAQAIANAVAQAFAQQQLAQQIATAVVSSIANALASIGQPQPAVATAPKTVRVAAVQAADTTDASTTTSATKATAVTKATPAVDVTSTVADPVASTSKVTEPAAVTEPDTSKVNTPSPVATVSEPTTPKPTTPEPTTSAAPESPSSSSAGAGNSAAAKGDGDGGQATTPKAPKAPKAPKKTDAAKPGQDKTEPEVRHPKGGGRDADSATDPKPKTEAASTSEGHATAG
ncbi:cellulase family glycosylhydrolase [Mycolicibacterium hodleri]